MRRRLLIGAGLSCLPILLLAGVVLALASDTLPVKSIAEVVPNDVVVFVQAEGLSDHLQAARQTQAWKDLESSAVVSMLLHENRRDLKGFRQMLEGRAERLGLQPTLETYMKFVGHDVGVGVRLDRESGEPSLIMLYRVDTPALLADLAVENPGALVRLLTDRYFGEEAGVLESYGGYDLFASPEGTVYALLRDVFVASDNPATVKRAIDLANAGGLGSLGRTPKYLEEKGRLPESTRLSLYVDIGRIRDPEVIGMFAGPEFTGKGLEALDRTVKPFPAIAVGIGAPGDNLYDLCLAVSRSADELLVDTESPSMRSLVPATGAAYIELEDIRKGVRAFRGSAMHERIKRSPTLRKLVGYLDSPQDLEGDLGIDLDLPRLPEELNTKFERTLGAKVLFGALGRIFPGALALGVDAPEQGGPPIPKIDFAVKLPPLLRVAEAFLTAGVIEIAAMEGGTDTAASFHGPRTVITLQETDGHWDDEKMEWVVDEVIPVAAYARVGDTFYFSTDHAGLKAKVAGSQSLTTAPAGALDQVPAGNWWLVRADYQRLGALLKAFGERELDQTAAMFADMGVDTVLAAGYIRDGFTTFQTRSWAKFTGGGGTMAGMYDQPAAPFDGWSHLPADTVLSFAWRLDTEGVLPMVRSLVLRDEYMREDFERGLKEVSEVMGVDVENELMPALGADMVFGIAPQSAEGEAIPVPALVLSWKLNDKATVDRALQTFLANVIPEPPPGATEEDLMEMPQHLTHVVGGSTVHIVQPPQREAMQTGGTLQPGYAICGDALVLSSSALAIANAASGGAGYTSSPAFQRATQAVGGTEVVSFFHADLDGLVRMIGGYAPMIAQAVPTPPPDGLEPPPFPEEEADMEQWQRDYEVYQMEVMKARRAAAQQNAKRISEACERIAGWVDFWAASGKRDGEMVVGEEILKFKP